jgi:hypothetical protein
MEQVRGVDAHLMKLELKHLALPARWRWPALAVLLVLIGSGFWMTREWVVSSRPHPETDQYRAREAQTVPLVVGLRSYDGVAAAAARLEAAGLNAARSSSHKAVSHRYPPRDLDTLEVWSYVHLGEGGVLVLEFFNDRLYEVRFVPEEIRRYLQKLHGAEPELRRDRNGRSELTRGDLRIATNVDLANSKVGRALATRPYVLWQDLRLKRQLADWETAYGAVAVAADAAPR